MPAELPPADPAPIGAGDLRRRLDELGSAPQLLEELILRAPVGLQLVDRSGRCVLVNPMHTQLFGAVPPPEYNIFDDTVLADSGVTDLVRRAFAGERITIPPLWYDARDLRNVKVEQGRRFAVGAELVPLRADGDGNSHVLFVFHDVTEIERARERAEAAAEDARRTREAAEQAAQRSAFLAEVGRVLSSSLDLSQTLAQVARLATPTLGDICVVDIVDPDGRVQRVAAAHAQLEGQALMDRLLGYPPVPGSPQPARRVLDTGQPELLVDVDAEVVASHTYDPVHRDLVRRIGIRSHVAVPLLARDQIVGVISLGYVGSRRYRAEDLPLVEALASRAAVAIDNARLYDRVARSEERFRLMADSVPQIVWITDAAGRTEFFNRQWSLYTGKAYEPTTAGDIAADFVHPDDAALTLERFEHARSTGGTFLVEHRIRSAAGEYRWFLVRGVPQRDPSTGQILRWFGASVDIHDLKTAEGALRESDRRKDEFLAMLAHELRNPLAAISNAHHLLRRDPAGPVAERYLDILGRQTRRLNGLMDDLLDVSRVTRGLITLRQEEVDLTGVVQRALESVQSLLDERRHELAVTLPRGPVRVLGDPGRLEQVLVNLVTNAAKYTDPGGHLAIELSRREGMARLEVRDDGIGMSPEFMSRIFDLFAQAERGLARSRGGLGVGLTIVRRLVELHGGRITAASEGLGLGSAFTVELPLQPAKAQPDAASPGAATLAAVRRRILVVDDSADIAETLALLLESSGHEVRTAPDGAAAIAAFTEFAPQVVLLDIGLPDMDGYEVARRLRSVAAGDACTLLALTGYGQPADRERAAEAGFDRHFVKPVDILALETFLGQDAATP